MRDVRVSTRALMVLCVALCVLAITQSGSGESSIPRIVRYSGSVPRLAGHMASVRASFYAAEGGAPLWAETQNVNFEANGGFTVLIGAQSTDGIPSFLFDAGVARWIGIEAEGEELHPRTMLLSVPYAIKAGDADTLGGKPFSAFVLASIASTASAAAEQIKASTTAPTSGAAAYVDNNYAEVLL